MTKPDGTVQPNANIGPIIDSAHQGYPTSARWVKSLWDHDYTSLLGTAPQHFINVQDDAKLHVIALLNPDVKDERIFAIASAINFNDIIQILRRIDTRRQWEDFPDDQHDLCVYEPSPRAEQLLKDAYGHGFVNLETSVRGNAADLASGGTS